MLPVWIAKMILNYFDINHLKTLKKVNAYWDFIITEIIDEKHIRQKLNKVRLINILLKTN